MKKKLASLLFCSLFAVQSNIFVSAKATDIKPNYETLHTHHPVLPSSSHLIDDPESIRSRIREQLIYVYNNPGMPTNLRWVIFKVSDGEYEKYICYQPSSPDSPDPGERKRIIGDIEQSSNCDVYGIDHILLFTQNVALEVDD